MRRRRDKGEVAAELVALVRDQIGPVAAFKLASVVESLPKTRSGKTLRRVIKAIAEGQAYKECASQGFTFAASPLFVPLFSFPPLT